VHRRSWSVVVSLLAVAATACSSGDEPAASAPTATEAQQPTSTTTTVPAARELPGDAEFYAVPDPLPAGAHGTLIRYQEVTPTVVDGATTYRIMYRSESLEGEPIAVTGTALVPEAPAPPDGRDLLTIAHGTTGIADECAPSKSPGSELLLMRDQVGAGRLVAKSDYEGLGTPGRHPYLVGQSEGRGVIDAILAARELPGADAGDRLAIVGYSQGGHGALWANQVAAEWAPDLDVVGTFAGAPATELQLILRAAPTGFQFLIVAGFGAAHPEADPALFLTPSAEARLDVVDEGCARDVFAAVSDLPRGQVVRPTAFEEGPWADLADQNDPGNVATDAPILVVHSDADEVVPIILSRFLLDRMCKVGQVVERRILTDGDGHGAAAPPAYRLGLAWLDDRFGDEPAAPVSSCES
jgi:predicted esterase